jgi:hypothetical protein
MSFFKKLRDKMFRSSDKIGEGLEALVAEDAAPPEVPEAPDAVTQTPAEAPVAARAEVPEPRVEAKPGLLGRLFGGGAAEEPRRLVDDAMLESLEELLIQADMGVDTAMRVTANIAEGRFGKKVSARSCGGRWRMRSRGSWNPWRGRCRFTPKAAGRAGGGGERVGQDHDHRQARQPVQGGGQDGGDCRRRHVPRGGGGAVADLGARGPGCRC